MARSGLRPGQARSGRWCALAAGCTGTAALLAACAPAPAVTQPAASAPHTASLVTDGHTSATLDVLTGTTTLTIGVTKFVSGGPLLRVSTPDGAPAPQLRVSGADGTARPGQYLVDLSASGAPAVTVTLNAAVSWQLNLDGGTTATSADLRGGLLTGIAFNAGSSAISVALPRPRGRVPVRMSGGASQFDLSLPAGVPAQVTAGGGASEVSLEDRDHVGVAGGSVFSTPGWSAGGPGFAIDATAGASSITVTARTS